MELRGFSFPSEFGIKRTFLKDIQMRRADYLTIAASLSYAIFGLTLFFTTQQFDVMGYTTGLTVFLVFPALALTILYTLYKKAAKREEQEKKKQLQVQIKQ
jgi:Na+-driven multidrug efflux pump